MNRIFRKLSPFIAIAAGVLFLYMGFHTIGLRKVYTETTAVITDIQTEYDGDETDHEVYVAYTVEGRDYVEELGEYSSGMRVGDEIGILYDPNEPDEIISAGAFGVIMEFVVGAIAIFGGISLIIKRLGGR